MCRRRLAKPSFVLLWLSAYHSQHTDVGHSQGITSLLLWLNAEQVVDALYIQVRV